MKQQLKEYFYFSKLERVGIISLIAVIILMVLARYLLIEYYPKVQLQEKDISRIEETIDSLEQDKNLKDKLARSKKYARPELDRIENFNPNDLSAEEWQEFGLSEKQANVLINYKTKIGGFKSKAQFRKVFVINDQLHNRLSPHVLLPDSILGNDKKFPKWEKKVYEKKVRVYPKVNINEADTAAFKKLYGIGSFSAEMIVKRREELGGFVSKDQLKEVYGLKEETLVRLDTQLLFLPTIIRQLSINEASKEELKAHPYLYWKHANAIVNYRKQHGKYQSLEELKKIVLINDSIYKKVKPYLKL